jgi:hypothetical protein
LGCTTSTEVLLELRVVRKFLQKKFQKLELKLGSKKNPSLGLGYSSPTELLLALKVAQWFLPKKNEKIKLFLALIIA